MFSCWQFLNYSRMPELCKSGGIIGDASYLKLKAVFPFELVTTMNIFGIGPLEIALILVLALIIFGPKDLQKTGKMLGSALNKIVHSENWQLFNKTRRELNNLPQRLMRESGVEELQKTATQTFSGAKADLEKAARTLEPDPNIQPPIIPAPPGSDLTPGSSKETPGE